MTVQLEKLNLNKDNSKIYYLSTRASNQNGWTVYVAKTSKKKTAMHPVQWLPEMEPSVM